MERGGGRVGFKHEREKVCIIGHAVTNGQRTRNDRIKTNKTRDMV